MEFCDAPNYYGNWSETSLRCGVSVIDEHAQSQTLQSQIKHELKYKKKVLITRIKYYFCPNNFTIEIKTIQT